MRPAHELKRQTLLSGVWRYDGEKETSVRIVRQNWDPHFEKGMEDHPPTLNDEGWCFYAVHGDEVSTGAHPHYLNISRACLSQEEARAVAEKAVDGPIDWGRSIWQSDASIP